MGALSAVPAGVLAQPAAAAGLSPPVADCQVHAKLTRSYPLSELRKALSGIPADSGEYSDCYDVIQQAIQADLALLHPRNDGSGSGGGSFLPVWLIVLLALLVLGGAAFTAFAWRRRGEP